jgi:hypothetical protein
MNSISDVWIGEHRGNRHLEGQMKTKNRKEQGLPSKLPRIEKFIFLPVRLALIATLFLYLGIKS